MMQNSNMQLQLTANNNLEVFLTKAADIDLKSQAEIKKMSQRIAVVGVFLRKFSNLGPADISSVLDSLNNEKVYTFNLAITMLFKTDQPTVDKLIYGYNLITTSDGILQEKQNWRNRFNSIFTKASSSSLAFERYLNIFDPNTDPNRIFGAYIDEIITTLNSLWSIFRGGLFKEGDQGFTEESNFILEILTILEFESLTNEQIIILIKQHNL